VSEDPVFDGVNWYTYCINNPVIYHDPSGKAFDFIIDAISAGVSLGEFIAEPSWTNFGFFAWGAVALILPLIPASYIAKGGKYLVKIAGHADDIHDTANTIEVLTDSSKVVDDVSDTIETVDNVADGIENVKHIFTVDNLEFSAKFDNPSQMNEVFKRGWNKEKIVDTINNPVKTSTSYNKYTGNTVTNYYIDDDHYVAVDDVTHKVIQVADLNKTDWKADDYIK